MVVAAVATAPEDSPKPAAVDEAGLHRAAVDGYVAAAAFPLVVHFHLLLFPGAALVLVVLSASGRFAARPAAVAASPSSGLVHVHCFHAADAVAIALGVVAPALSVRMAAATVDPGCS